MKRLVMMLALALGVSCAISFAAASDAVPAATAAISRGALGPDVPPPTREMLANVHPVTAPHAMVVSAQHLATEVGVDILRRGGNAIDAAVAIGYALAVVHPCCGNIGGGGFMTIHLADGRNLFLDFRERAPLKASYNMFRNAQDQVVRGRSTNSYLAVGVPGTVLGLETARSAYGSMSRQDLLAPAIRLAREGFVLTDADATLLQFGAHRFAQHPNVAAIFLDHGNPYPAGARLRQPQLAQTLELISQQGPRAFYHGSIARAIVTASEGNGGLLTMKDFAEYNVQWQQPIRCHYRGYEVISAPPPSSGGATICELLQILEPYPLAQWGYASTQVTHYLAEAERYAYADRNTDLGDPAFVVNPIAMLLSPQHAATIRAHFMPDKAVPEEKIEAAVGGGIEGQHTTHYSVVDAHGNAVAVTYTINLYFGNGQIAGDTGFFLNNEMDDFTSKVGVPNSFGLVQGRANLIAPGKRPLSSMSPTLVLDHGQLFMVTGSPGGSTIISTTLESILNVVDFGMNIQQAVDAPRMHDQGQPDAIMVEPGYLTSSAQTALEQMGYHIQPRHPWGADEAILRDPHTGLLEGANDVRRPGGLAAGY
jgi:gamma-glutamyltranspeptidase / glutathione hydrolase